MKTNNVSPIALAVATAAAPGLATAAPAVDDLLNRIRSQDENVRGEAWQKAGPAGAPAIKPLAALMTDNDFELARSARRAIWNIVYHGGRPGATKEARAIEIELIALLDHKAVSVRREVLWMLSELAGDDAVPPIGRFLADPELREDARCALQRIPGGQSLGALKRAMQSAPEEFRYALAESLRARGETVSGYPSRKLVPTRPMDSA